MFLPIHPIGSCHIARILALIREQASTWQAGPGPTTRAKYSDPLLRCIAARALKSQRHHRGVMEGGAASTALPHCLFGNGPIVSDSVQPSTISAWLNHGLFHALPLSVADWIYIFFAELLRATIVKSCPLPRWIVALSKIGLPRM
jgi:hypothetical protein